MWIESREKQCAQCANNQTHEIDEIDIIHEVCEAGNCVLCFQSGKYDCSDFIERK